METYIVYKNIFDSQTKAIQYIYVGKEFNEEEQYVMLLLDGPGTLYNEGNKAVQIYLARANKPDGTTEEAFKDSEGRYFLPLFAHKTEVKGGRLLPLRARVVVIDKKSKDKKREEC